MGVTFKSKCMGSGVRRANEGDNITVRESDGFVVAKDDVTGVSSQGETKSEALENLAEALRLYHRPEPQDEEPTEPSDAPWF